MLRTEGRGARPGAVDRVPALATVRVDHRRFVGGFDGGGHQIAGLDRIDAVDPDRDDGIDAAGHGEALLRGFAGPGPPAGAGHRQPRRYTEVGQFDRQRLDLGEARDRLDGEADRRRHRPGSPTAGGARPGARPPRGRSHRGIPTRRRARRRKARPKPPPNAASAWMRRPAPLLLRPAWPTGPTGAATRPIGCDRVRAGRIPRTRPDTTR